MGFAQTQCKLALKTNLDFKQELGNMENNFASIIGKEKKSENLKYYGEVSIKQLKLFNILKSFEIMT